MRPWGKYFRRYEQKYLEQESTQIENKYLSDSCDVIDIIWFIFSYLRLNCSLFQCTAAKAYNLLHVRNG